MAFVNLIYLLVSAYACFYLFQGLRYFWFGTVAASFKPEATPVASLGIDRVRLTKFQPFTSFLWILAKVWCPLL